MSDIAQKNETYQGGSPVLDDVRYEFFEGVIHAMAPPSSDHQIMLFEIAQQLSSFLKGKQCQAFIAPFGVDLTEFTESKIKTLFQPDITVVCDPAKLNRRTGTYYGSPSLIVEVAAPSTIDKDLNEKKNLYELAGVQEYLVILDRSSALLFTLKDGTYQKQVFENDGTVSIPVTSFPGLTLELRPGWFWFGGAGMTGLE